MKKYKLEVSILAIFVSLIVALLWSTMAAKFAMLPYLLLGVAVVALGAAVSPWGESQTAGAEKDSEKYAPKYFAQAIISSAVGIAIIVGLAAIANRDRFSKSFDLTERKVNSISDESVKFLASLEKPVAIFCIPSMDPRERYCEENMQLRGLFAEKSKFITHDVIDMRDMAALQKVKPTGYSRLVILTENNRSEVAGKVTESKLTNALINLIKSKKVVYFLSGSGEPTVTGEVADRNYAAVAEVLKNRAYDVKEHNITSGDLPADAQLVVAGSSTVPYSNVVENMLRRFIARGGRLVLSLNPHRDPGMPKLFADLGIKLDNNILMHNLGATQLGGQLVQLNPMRPPVVVGEFSKDSPMTNVFNARDVALVDDARSMVAMAKGDGPIKLKQIQLMSVFHAAPAQITDEARGRLTLDGALGLKPDAGFDPKKTWAAAFSVEIDGASKLAEGIPAATVAINDTASAGAGMGTAKPAADEPKDVKKEDKSEVVIFGFEIASRYDRIAPANTQILPLAVSHLYRDKELVSIPNKDFAPRQFSVEKNPAGFLFLFAGFLPVATALTGFYIWMRRRSA